MSRKASVGWVEQSEAQHLAPYTKACAWNKNGWASFFRPTYPFILFLAATKIVPVLRQTCIDGEK